MTYRAPTQYVKVVRTTTDGIARAEVYRSDCGMLFLSASKRFGLKGWLSFFNLPWHNIHAAHAWADRFIEARGREDEGAYEFKKTDDWMLW